MVTQDCGKCSLRQLGTHTLGYCDYVAATVFADGLHSRVKQCSEGAKQASADGSLYSRGFRGTSASRSGRRHSIGQ